MLDLARQLESDNLQQPDVPHLYTEPDNWSVDRTSLMNGTTLLGFTQI